MQLPFGRDQRRAETLQRFWSRLKKHPLSRIGPGLITGVADDDPSGIATYSQAGAQFGLNMLWTMPIAFPLMAVLAPVTALADPCKAIPEKGPLPSYLARGSTFTGTVTYVGDGDSLCVAVGRGRLIG